MGSSGVGSSGVESSGVGSDLDLVKLGHVIWWGWVLSGGRVI